MGAASRKGAAAVAADAATAAAPPAADAATDAAAAALAERFGALSVRLDAAERAAALSERLGALLARIAAAERALTKPSSASAPSSATAAAATATAAAADGAADGADIDAAREAGARAALEAALAGDGSPVQHRLARELCERRVPGFRFVRVPSDYYDRPLEWRRDVLGAASVHHLCKVRRGGGAHIHHTQVSHITHASHTTHYTHHTHPHTHTHTTHTLLNTHCTEHHHGEHQSAPLCGRLPGPSQQPLLPRRRAVHRPLQQREALRLPPQAQRRQGVRGARVREVSGGRVSRPTHTNHDNHHIQSSTQRPRQRTIANSSNQHS